MTWALCCPDAGRTPFLTGRFLQTGTSAGSPAFLLLYLAGGLISLSAAASDACPTIGSLAPSVVPSRTTGVAPLAVFFDATGTTSGVTTRPFHEIEYQWTFGDADGGKWFPTDGSGLGVRYLNQSEGTATAVTATPHGINTGDRVRISGVAQSGYNTVAAVTVVNATTFTYLVPVGTATPATGTIKAAGQTGKSRNSAMGPVAAHVYETAGAYSVALNAKDGTNTVSCSVQVTVTDPGTVFSNTSTTCVSATGTFMDCPTGARQVTTANFDMAVNRNIGWSKRVLFRRGETFSAPAGASVSAAGPGIIGAFGTGELPVVLIGTDGGCAIGLKTGAPSDWRFMDLDIRRNGHRSTCAIDGTGRATKNQITVLRLRSDASTGVPIDSNSNTQPAQCAVVDSTFTSAENAQIYGYCAKVAVLGNNIMGANVAGIVNLIRPIGFSGAVLSGNALFGGTSTGGSAITVRTHGDAISAQAGKTVISDNYIDAGSNGSVAELAISAATDLQMKDVIIERNFLITLQGGVGVDVGGVDSTTVRNNLILLARGAGANDPIGIQLRGALVGTHNNSNSKVYNNTIYNNASGGVQELMYATAGGATVTGAVFRNNLGYAPLGGIVRMLNDSVGGATASNNSTDLQAKTVNPFRVPSPKVPAEFSPQADSYVIGAGTRVPVYSDFFLVPRSSYDLGAVRRVSETRRKSNNP